MEEPKPFNLAEYEELSKAIKPFFYVGLALEIIFMLVLLAAALTRDPLFIGLVAIMIFFGGGLQAIASGFLADKQSRYMQMSQQVLHMSKEEKEKVFGTSSCQPPVKMRGLLGTLAGLQSRFLGSRAYRLFMFALGLMFILMGIVFLVVYF